MINFRLLFDYHYGAPQNRRGKYCEIIHTTDRQEVYREFVDGIYAEGDEYKGLYYLGEYKLRYTDGAAVRKLVYLGEHIGSADVEWYGRNVVAAASDAAPGLRSTRLEQRIGEAAYTTLPIRIGGKVYYKFLLENPCQDKIIAGIEFVLPKNANWHVDIQSIKVL